MSTPIPLFGPAKSVAGFVPIYNTADGQEIFGGAQLFHITTGNNTVGVAPGDLLEEASTGEYKVVPVGGVTAGKFAGVVAGLYNSRKEYISGFGVNNGDYLGKIVPAGVECYVSLCNPTTVKGFLVKEDLGDTTPVVIGTYVGSLGSAIDSNGYSTFTIARTTDNATFGTTLPFLIQALNLQTNTPGAATAGTYVVSQVYSKFFGIGPT